MQVGRHRCQPRPGGEGAWARGTGRFVSISFKSKIDPSLQGLIGFTSSTHRQTNEVGTLRSLHYTLTNKCDETLYIRPIHGVSPCSGSPGISDDRVLLLQ